MKYVKVAEKKKTRYWLGRKRDDPAYLKKISDAHLGKPSAKKGKHYPNAQGKNSTHWKGDGIGYRGLHLWVEKNLGKPQKCDHCLVDGLAGRKIHWANKSHKYLRDKSDWIRLCVPCHIKFDRK